MKPETACCADCYFQTILDTALFGVLVTDCKGYLIYINNMARSLIGFHDDINAKKTHYAEIDYTSWLNFSRIIETREPQIGIPVMNFSKPMLANRSPITKSGEVVGIISVFHELEKYESISEYLQKYKNLTKQLEAILDSSYDGIFITDSEGIGIRSNAAYERITGVDSSEFIGRNMQELEQEGQISQSATLKVLQSRKTETITQRSRIGKVVLATGNPIFNDQGEISMVLTNLRDMTDLNRLILQLQQSEEINVEYKKRLQEFQRASRSEKTDVVAASEAMKNIYQTAQCVCNTDTPVFIHGETGVGKDIIAQEIHNLSERSSTGILVKINCGAIPETLLESELFGYASGAFTGANGRGKPGLFEVADKGTLFLDEIDSMPLTIQSKLLRVLQDFEIRRLGNTVSKKVNVRLICAANQNMKELIQKKLFRSDLYYRLNVIPIHIPPLRERSEEIPILIQIFMKRFNLKHSMRKSMSRDCCAIMTQHNWPGNVRELANVIERLVILTRDDCIMATDLPDEIHNQFQSEKTSIDMLTLREQLKFAEEKIISEAIKKYGNARRAAMHLGVNPSTICRKLCKKERKSAFRVALVQ
jgi:PAS domain S-box-containing protein